jgi:M6 family metalloprotease-like protein
MSDRAEADALDERESLDSPIKVLREYNSERSKPLRPAANASERSSMMRPAVALLLLFAGSVVPVVDAAAEERTLPSLTGVFEIVWADGRMGTPVEKAETFFLTTDEGETVRVQIDDAVLEAAGGMLNLNRKRVTIIGARVSDAGVPDGQIVWEASRIEPSAELVSDPVSDAVSGSLPFISILCKFPETATEPQGTAFFQNMYATSYPGLDHFWREQSYATVNLLGSGAAGWFTLPHPRSHYFSFSTINLTQLALDCTATADASVNFASYAGINMMFNGELDCCAHGGSRHMTLDGVTKSWRVTWNPPWAFANVAVVSHEMGHSFGLAHSTGMYGAIYDNQWDLMSDTWTNCANSRHATYGCLGFHTISRHKDQLEWIPPANRFALLFGETATITLERLALPQSGSHRIAILPIGNSTTRFYTAEVRRRAGYDVQLPGEGVIIHEIDLTRSRPARVVDADGNFDTGDAGATWTPGETFTDPMTGVSVQVHSSTATGYVVTLSSPPPPVLTINDVAVVEGHSGTTNAVFTATLSAATPATVTADFATLDQTAGGGKVVAYPYSILIPPFYRANTYPALISVTDMPGTIAKVTVTLEGFTHPAANEVDVLLVGPGGQSVLVMADVGDYREVSGVTLTFDDTAASPLGSSAPVSGTYQPTNIGDSDSFPSPAPQPPYGSSMSAFNGQSANGYWKLFILDDFDDGGANGSLRWSLAISTTGGDYLATRGTLRFAPGETIRTVSVPVTGDAVIEANETFFVNLSGVVNATFADAQGMGTIANDDNVSAPANVVATATSATAVNIFWTTVPGVSGYRVYRSSGGAYSLVGSSDAPPFSDTSVSANTSYFYKVRSFSGVESGDSNRDLATTTMFTDPVLTAGSTRIRRAHFTELLTAVNAMRMLAGLGTIEFTAPAPSPGLSIRRQHLLELRTALDAARAALTLSASSYTDPSITAGATRIKTKHITELRDGTW